jgi:2-isopropylmalate synthase
LAVANSLWAVAAGAHQVHAAANSLGERVGNTPMELMLVNLRLMGLIAQDLSHLKEYCETVAAATHTVIPPNYPVIGKDAFRTQQACMQQRSSKLSSKAILSWRTSYTAACRRTVWLEQVIEIGPMSGKSNVLFWLERRGIPADDALVARLLDAAKKSARVLTEDELLAPFRRSDSALKLMRLVSEKPGAFGILLAMPIRQVISFPANRRALHATADKSASAYRARLVCGTSCLD